MKFLFAVYLMSLPIFAFDFDVKKMWDSTVETVKDTVNETGIFNDSSDYSLKNVTEDEVRIAFKESLNSSFKYSADILSQKNGFNKFEETKISFPTHLKLITSVLNQFDGSKFFDGKEIVLGFENSLNRSAENSLEKMALILEKVINETEFNNVKSFLFDGKTGITDGFVTKQENNLFELIRPIVVNQMKLNDSKEYFLVLQEIYKKVMFGIKDFETFSTVLEVGGYDEQSLKYQDLENYLTEKVLEALFFHMSKHEEKIRVDKNLRTSNNLEKVFKLQD